jgi:hypothetical protein
MKFFCPDIGHTTAAVCHTSVAARFCPDVLLSYCLDTTAPNEECVRVSLTLIVGKQLTLTGIVIIIYWFGTQFAGQRATL